MSKDYSKKKRALKTFAAIFAVAFALFVLANLRLVYLPIRDFAENRITFNDMILQIHYKYEADIVGKYNFINLNGLYSRLTGHKTCNGVMKLRNGMLDYFNPEREDMSKPANAIIELADFAKTESMEFLYIQSPTKLDENGEILLNGEENHMNENADDLLLQLTNAGVETYDLREYMAKTPEQIEEYFFRTDHHWNFTGAFTAYQLISEELYQRLGDRNIELSHTDIDNWESYTLKNWMLGSRGRRTGAFFAGTDDITYYLPKFETKMSCNIPYTEDGPLYYEGNFEETFIRREYISGKRPDLFNSSPYCMYIGEDYVLEQIRSESAKNDLKICIVRDSFVTPVITFLSTEFKYIDSIDPRRSDDFNVAQYIRETKPDIVIVMLSPTVLNAYTQYSDFGVKSLVG